MDWFANFTDPKSTKFYSRYWNPDAESVDAFRHDWGGESNWLVPLVLIVLRVIRHLAAQASQTHDSRNRSNIIVIPPNSNTFPDWRRTCHVPLVKTQ